MKTKDISLLLYFICCFLAIFAQIKGNDTLTLISRTVLFPAIFSYYFNIAKKINIFFTIMLVCFYISNIIITLKFENETLYLLLPYAISYLILIRFAINDIIRVKLNFIDTITSVIVFGLLTYILYSILIMLTGNQLKLIFPLFISGSLLVVLSTIVTYNYIAKNTTSNFYFCICCMCFIIYNVFYLLYELVFFIPIFDYISISIQMISYFFLVKYILNRKPIIN